MFDLLIKGGVVMIPIGICSILALAIIIERFWSLRSQQIVPKREIQYIESLVNRGRLNEAIDVCEGNPSNSSYRRIVLSGLDKAGEKRHIIKEVVEEAGRQEVVYLERYLTLLGTIASITPLLGLLGTVLGMIKVFATISAVGVGDPSVLASGIGESLITTAAGLTVAIPTVSFHRYFNRVIDRHVVALERSALVIVEHIKSGH
ncbi:MAG: MotA/TolQ/ExbB proton channel family protein [Magnetococcales bacterium]|nr:MotA/TolQ/ExbB proton channel family protein [Magnetococcales bacterium]